MFLWWELISGGHDTDEKIPMRLFLEDMEDMLEERCANPTVPA